MVAGSVILVLMMEMEMTNEKERGKKSLYYRPMTEEDYKKRTEKNILDNSIKSTLEKFANQDNWECRLEYGPYEGYYTYLWIGGDTPWEIAQDMLEEFLKSKNDE